jgi:hypothetical protein
LTDNRKRQSNPAERKKESNKEIKGGVNKERKEKEKKGKKYFHVLI